MPTPGLLLGYRGFRGRVGWDGWRQLCVNPWAACGLQKHPERGGTRLVGLGQTQCQLPGYSLGYRASCHDAKRHDDSFCWTASAAQDVSVRA